MSTVEPEEIHWLWPGRLPLGKLVILDGDPGLGKSTVMLDLCARGSLGEPFPGSQMGQPPFASMILSAEDGVSDTIKPRLLAARARDELIFVFEEHQIQG